MEPSARISTAAGSSRFSRMIRTFGRLLPLLLGAAALLQPLGSMLARYEWRADLLTPFQEPALAVTLVAILALVRRHWRLAAALTVLAVIQAVPLLRYSGSNPVPPPGDRDRLRVLMANVCVDNPDRARVAEFIRRERPDVVGLVEVNTSWLEGLDAVRREFPHRLELPIGTRGLSLWFRHPPISVDPPEVLTTDANPVLHAVVILAGRPRHIWLMHPPNPLTPRGRAHSNAELAALATRIGLIGGSRLVVGDMNRTDGSPYFRDFVRESGLRDSRLGFGRQPSWPVWSPYRIAIDHAFLSSDLAVVDRRLGPDIGSDHRPLILDVAPAAGPVAATNSAAQPSQSSP